MKKPSARGRTAQPSGILAKMLGQAVPQPVRSAPAATQAQALYEAAVAFYYQAEWDQAEAQADALLAMPGLHATHEVAALNLKATLAARTHRLELAVSLYQAIDPDAAAVLETPK